MLLPDVLVLDKKFRDSNFSFIQLVKAWNKTGVGQIMVERVGEDMLEHYGIADLGDLDAETFKSVPLQGLVEKPHAHEAPSNLSVLGRYILPFEVLGLLEKTVAGVGEKYSLQMRQMDCLNSRV